MEISSSKIKEFQQKIWTFYTYHKRLLPWRQTTNPYNILVSEIMLQQTQVPRVLVKYNEFLKEFPTLKSLAEASLKRVLGVWQGMGYNRRALYLKKIAEKIDGMNKMHSDVSIHHYIEPATLETLPGIGKNTAAAITVFSKNIPLVFIETNIRRVFIHEFFKDQATIHDRQLLPLIEKTLDQKNPREWYYALMDYGTHLGKTIENPNRKSKHYVIQTPLKGSIREARGKILKILLSHTSLSKNSEKT